MNEEEPGWLGRRWGRLGTGTRMFLILATALMPLGLIAILASIYSARENSEQRAEQTLSRLEAKTRQVDDLISRSSDTLRAASTALEAAPSDPAACARTLAQVAALQKASGRYALFDGGGALRCATAGFNPAPPGPIPAEERFAEKNVEITPDATALRLTVYRGTSAQAVAEFDRAALSALTFIPGTRADFRLELSGGGRRLLLRDDYRRVPVVRTVTDSAPIDGGRLDLRITLGAIPIRLTDVLLILLPVLMWISAAVIGWWTVNRQLVRPLAAIQRAVSAYRPGEAPLELPTLKTSAREIGELGLAFEQVTLTVARHEAELEAAVERQTRLVREVHHRVKNNLQVVASLLNLHSRGSPSPDAAAAYASIQRRVDALAVVHRNHYAELEENRGVALKPLISELAANLRATAPAGATAMQMRLDVAPVYVTQDVAVSVAFLVTEMTEYGMLCGASQVTVVIEPIAATQASLAIEVDSLAESENRDEAVSDRFERIITGLARQLRSTLERDTTRGRYALTIAIADRGDEAGAA
jgi:two-component sensor histidine kinase